MDFVLFLVEFDRNKVMLLLVSMYKKKMKEGDGLFFNLDDESTAMDLSMGLDTLCYRKFSLIFSFSFPESLLQADKQLEVRPGPGGSVQA